MKKKLTTKEEYTYRINIIQQYIREHIDEEINLDMLAKLSAFSPFHFHRIISAYLGESIGMYIIRIRLENAAKLLRYTDEPVSDIAYKVGYNIPSSFNKAFKKFFGISPNEFRTNNNFKIMTQKEDKKEFKLKNPKILEMDEKTVIYIRAKGDYSSIDYSSAFQRLWTEVKKQNLFSAGIEHLGIYYDNPKITFADQLSCDICLRVCKEPQPDNEIGVKKIASGKYAVFIHIGPYNEVGDTYDKIYGEWLPQSGYQTGNKPCYEKYISDPRRVIPEKLKTELYISIE